MSDTDPAYIGVEPCGCVTSAQVDMPAYKRDTAKTIAQWVRDGRTVERVTVAEARERLVMEWPCEHVKAIGKNADQLELA